MIEKKRLAAPERKKMMIENSMRVFAQKGFGGATSRELAAAAGVSEALLYKYFPSKEALYGELVSMLVSNKENTHALLTRETPSSGAFIRAFHMLSRIMLFGPPGRAKDDSVDRLIGQSLLGDGSFAASFFRTTFEPIIPHLTECLRVAWADGDLDIPTAPGELHSVLFHHFIGTIALFNLPPRQMLPTSDPEELFREALLFAYRGIGFTEAAIQKFGDFSVARR